MSPLESPNYNYSEIISWVSFVCKGTVVDYVLTMCSETIMELQGLSFDQNEYYLVSVKVDFVSEIISFPWVVGHGNYH